MTTERRLTTAQITTAQVDFFMCTFQIYNCTNCDQLHTKINPAPGKREDYCHASKFVIIEVWLKEYFETTTTKKVAVEILG